MVRGGLDLLHHVPQPAFKQAGAGRRCRTWRDGGSGGVGGMEAQMLDVLGSGYGLLGEWRHLLEGIACKINSCVNLI